MDEGRVVLLGTIQEHHKVDTNSPYVCKAGGTPAWYSKPPPESDTLFCSKCSNRLFLVIQVYAPVETDRTLYVFGCNAVACTENAGSWRVLRDQVTPAVKESKDLEENELKMPVVRNKLAWGMDSDGSDWSDEDDSIKEAASTADLVDLEVLLQKRDDAMKISKTTIKSNGAVKKFEAAEAIALKSHQNVFPVLAIKVMDEPYEDYSAEHDFAHENRLFEDYMLQEEEEKSSDFGDLQMVITNSKKCRGTARNSGSGHGESYEKTPAKQRHLLRFQKRINRCPLQCLRYDYGGEPLWPVTIPQNLNVPSCPGCGEKRLFEMQLTPTINYFLKVDEHVPADNAFLKKPAVPGVGVALLNTPTGGMDWLSLIVYSCSASCSHSREEFVYVVP